MWCYDSNSCKNRNSVSFSKDSSEYKVLSLPQFKYCILQTEKLPPLKQKTEEVLSKYSKQWVFHQENNGFHFLEQLKYFCSQLHSYYWLFLLTFILSGSDSLASGKRLGHGENFSRIFSGKEGVKDRDQSCSYFPIACLPRDTATFCVSKLTQMSGTREPQSGNTGIFVPLPREDKRLYYSYFWH